MLKKRDWQCFECTPLLDQEMLQFCLFVALQTTRAFEHGIVLPLQQESVGAAKQRFSSLHRT